MKFLSGRKIFFGEASARGNLRQAEERSRNSRGNPFAFTAPVDDLSREQGQFGDRPECRFLRRKWSHFL